MLEQVWREKRGSITAAAAGFTAFVNIYSLQTLLPTMSETFAAGERQVGLAVGATTLAVALASPFAGWLVGRLTRGRVTKISVGGLVACGLLVAMAPTLNALIFWRFCQGLFLPILIAGVLSFLAEDFEARRLSRATSNYVTWTIVGGFCGRWLSGSAAAHWGWRQALLLLTLANAVAGLALLLSLKDPDRRSRGKKPPTARCFFATFSQPALRGSYLIGFGSLFTMVGVFTYVTFHLASAPFALSPAELGNVFCVYLLGITVTPFVGAVVPNWGHQLTVERTAKLSCLGMFFTLIPRLETVIFGLALICVAGFATQACVSGFLAQLPAGVKSVACGLYLSAYYFGGCLGAVIPGAAWEKSGWMACVLMFALVQTCIWFCSRNLSRY